MLKKYFSVISNSLGIKRSIIIFIISGIFGLATKFSDYIFDNDFFTDNIQHFFVLIIFMLSCIAQLLHHVVIYHLSSLQPYVRPLMLKAALTESQTKGGESKLELSVYNESQTHLKNINIQFIHFVDGVSKGEAFQCDDDNLRPGASVRVTEIMIVTDREKMLVGIKSLKFQNVEFPPSKKYELKAVIHGEQFESYEQMICLERWFGHIRSRVD